MSTKELVTNILRVVTEKPVTIVEIAKTTKTSESFTNWIINGARYRDLFGKTIPRRFNPAIISPSPKGRQFLADSIENQSNLL